MNPLINRLKGKIIVSCQARKGEPFDDPLFIAEFAKSAELGGASALRIDGGGNIKAVKKVTSLPVLGIKKQKSNDSEVFITPTMEAVAELVSVGANIIGLDGTKRTRPGNTQLEDLIQYCHKFNILVLADIATEEDAEYAISKGADLIATTLSGYTNETMGKELPDFNLLETLSSKHSVPIFLEGGVTKTEHVRMALEKGAHGIIIGKIITMPNFITRQFVNETEMYKGESLH
jgi:N-acylglucosamine-6-phosphate 2-epimerase